jgi:signal transduction histidine kinase
MTAFYADLHVIMAFSYLTNVGLAILLAWSGRNFQGAWLWVMGQGLLALGTVSDALPAGVPLWITLVLGNAAYTAASVLLSHSVWVFRFSAPFPRWAYLAIPLQILSFALAMGEPYVTRALVFSAWETVGPLISAALLLWRVEPRLRLWNGLTAFPFGILSLASLVRIVVIGHLALRGQIVEVSPLNVIYVSGAILLSTIMLFGYFMMTRIQSEQTVQRLDAEIQERNRKLVEAARAKDLFFAIVAHDLRGPIGGAARYVRKHLFGKMTGLEPRYPQVETLATSLEKTHAFLEKLLWWSRSQLYDWTPKTQALDLGDLLKAVVAALGGPAHSKGIRLDMADGPFPTPGGDPESVQLILGNLLSNAIKYSYPGKTIRLTVTPADGGCRISVVDEGVGIHEANLKRLFRIEDKLSTVGTHDEQGGGLGLILAQSLAQRNGGLVTLESEVGRGTVASLWLPLAGEGAQ